MGDMLEVLFSCDDNDNQLSCTAWDFRTGTNLMSYKGGGCVPSHSLHVLRSEYVIAGNSHKPLLHVWPINSQEQLTSVRFVVPGKVNALTFSPDGYFLLAGIEETIYIWHITTGRLLNTVSKHFQAIKCLRFTDDGGHFVSAANDGTVLVWTLANLISRDYFTSEYESKTPLYSFNDHGLPVTDVHIGMGGLRAYMLTVSMDRSCKVYDLNSGTLLLSLLFPEALKCVAYNKGESNVYVGTTEGNIYEFTTDSPPRTKEYHVEKEHTNRFVGHKAGTAVQCLVLSLDGETLISGGQDQQVCVWHIASRQLIKAMQQKGAITNLTLRLTSPAIFEPQKKQPDIFKANLKRMIDPIEAEEDEVIEVLVTEQNSVDYNKILDDDDGFGFAFPELNKASNVAASGSGGDSTAELNKLREEVQHLKRVNKELFELSAKQLLRK